MSVLVRLALWLLMAGLALGVTLRWLLGRRPFWTLLWLATLLPWTLHAGTVALHVWPQRASAWGLAAYLAVGAALIAAGLVAGRRWTVRRGVWAALVPALVAATYVLGPFALFSLALRRQAVALDVVPTAAYLGASLFATALLLPFAPGGGAMSGSWRGRRIRRR